MDGSGSAANGGDMIGENLGVEVDGNTTKTLDYNDFTVFVP
jgi:hypothetical protein